MSSGEERFQEKVRGLAKRLALKKRGKTGSANWEEFIPRAYDILDSRGESLKERESPADRTAIGLLNAAEKHGLLVPSGSAVAKRRGTRARSLGYLLGGIAATTGRAKTRKGLSGKPSPSVRWGNLETGELAVAALKGKLTYTEKSGEKLYNKGREVIVFGARGGVVKHLSVREYQKKKLLEARANGSV